jgi:protein SCO1/2
MNSPSEKNSSWLYIVAAGVALLSAAAGASLWQMMQERSQAQTAALLVLPEPRVIDDFELVGMNGQAFTLDDLRGRWTLVFFGFTHCPDVCPSTLYDLQRVNQDLDSTTEETPPLHQVLFVSVDPERDSPERMKEYLAYFSPEFLGATGPDQNLAPLTRQLGIAYRIEEHEPGDAVYTVDHSASVLLIEPEGRLYGVFTAPLDAAAVSADLAALLN